MEFILQIHFCALVAKALSCLRLTSYPGCPPPPPEPEASTQNPAR